MARSDLKIALFSAILFTLSFPPFPLGFLAPVALAVLLNHFIRNRPQNVFAVAYIQAVFWGVFTLFWIAVNTLAGATMAILINALHYAFFWWLFVKLYDWRQDLSLAFFPFLWTGLEFLRQFSEFRFNWLNLAYTQTYYVHFIQFVEWTGFLGLSFLVSAFGVLLYAILRYPERRLAWSGLLIFLFALPWGYGIRREKALAQLKPPTVAVGLVQPDVDPYKKWESSFRDSAYVMLAQSTRKLARQGARLVIWPETATPFFLRYEPLFLQKTHQLVDSLGINLLTGTPDIQIGRTENEYKTFNSAFFFVPHRPGFQKYDKMALVPAAESMPYKRFLPFLRKINVGGGDFFPGNKFQVFESSIPLKTGPQKIESHSKRSKSLKISAVICFESIFPNLVRPFVARGADLLAIITNDAWFGRTSGPYQHAQYAVLRAVENRISIVRCANTGISMIIDYRGKVLLRTRLWRKQDVLFAVPIYHEATFYDNHGEWFGDTVLLIVAAVLCLYFFEKYRNKKV